jgi:hypothetical protein
LAREQLHFTSFGTASGGKPIVKLHIEIGGFLPHN